MSFDAMAPYRNKVTTHIWAVSKSGLVPVRKYEVKKETDKTFVLDDGTVVRKTEMQNNYQMFFTDEYAADVTYRHLNAVFDHAAQKRKSNFDIVSNATIDTLPNVLIGMIHELCEDGMPSEECIKEWLLSASDENSCVDEGAKDPPKSNAMEQEDYSNLKDGDAVYYVDFNDNKVVLGVALGVRRKCSDSSVKYFSIDAPNDFMGCSGELLGEKVFLNKELAEKKLREGKKDV